MEFKYPEGRGGTRAGERESLLCDKMFKSPGKVLTFTPGSESWHHEYKNVKHWGGISAFLEENTQAMDRFLPTMHCSEDVNAEHHPWGGVEDASVSPHVRLM